MARACAAPVHRRPHPSTDEDAGRFIVTLSDAAGCWAVVEKQAFRGAVEVMDGELGFWIGRSSWGRGSASEAACAACGAWFGAGGEALRSSCMEGDHASRRVLLKLGFEDTGPRTIRSASLGRDVPGRAMRLARAPLCKVSA